MQYRKPKLPSALLALAAVAAVATFARPSSAQSTQMSIPTSAPTIVATTAPTTAPTTAATTKPTSVPTLLPTTVPTTFPVVYATSVPTTRPTTAAYTAAVVWQGPGKTFTVTFPKIAGPFGSPVSVNCSGTVVTLSWIEGPASAPGGIGLPAGSTATTKTSDCAFSGVVPAAAATHGVIVTSALSRSAQNTFDANASQTIIQTAFPFVRFL